MRFRPLFRLYPFGLGLVAILTMLYGCSAETIDNDSPPDVQYQEGERLLKKDRYVEAVERFRILKSRYPYSKYAALATLKVGDAHYQEESYIEAASAYKVFRELYPKHEFAAYALYRIGESHYNEVPSSVDRDLDAATSAIEAYSQLIKEYPNDEHVKEAATKVHELKGKLAEKEDYVANFYYKRELYQAAAGRYSYLVDNYGDFGHNRDGLYRLAFSYERMGEYRKASDTLERLDSEFPDGKDGTDRKNLRNLITAGLEKPE
ncbi:MAG: outer membrane protein assembly factor BamD [Bdellovibrionota bacterium]